VRHVTYVWFDALTNYITAAGYGQPDEAAEFAKWWPAVHLIGKDIIRFHCVYWPAMLLSAGAPLPTHVVVHGYLTADGQKISKSLGNTIDPLELIDQYGADPLRFTLVTSSTPGNDINLDSEKV
jgi:methionyl-tRNA synthetase